MSTLTQDKQTKDSGVPPTPAVPGRPGAAGGRVPPQYPNQPSRRPPNVPTPASQGGGGGGPQAPRPVATSGSGGYFSIYKRGQGYWTRMGTLAGAALIGAMTIQFVWSERDTFGLSTDGAELVCAVLAVAYGALAFFILNSPKNVDFLIATDSEMKKVNWTTQKDLMGSTKVVILFMFVIAIFLFVMDIIFGYFFYFIHVLKERPF